MTRGEFTTIATALVMVVAVPVVLTFHVYAMGRDAARDLKGAFWRCVE